MVVNEALDLAGERLPFKPQLVSKHDRIHLARFPLPRYLTPIYPLTLSQGGMGGFVTHLLRNSIVDFIGFLWCPGAELNSRHRDFQYDEVK